MIRNCSNGICISYINQKGTQLHIIERRDAETQQHIFRMVITNYKQQWLVQFFFKHFQTTLIRNRGN